MITRVLRSGRPGVLFKFALLGAGAWVFGLGCATTTPPARTKPTGPEVVVYRFKFTADPGGGLCTITQEDVVTKNKEGKEIPADCDGNKKCGRASIPNGDSIGFESIPAGKAFEVVFDPFKHGPVPGNQEKKLHKDWPGVTGRKTYTFSVVAKDCNTLDPIIVVDH
jgi:hypothetical protein